MSWTTPITWTFGQTVTAAQLNSQIRDNLNETSTAKATTAGGYYVATAANTLAERVVVHAFDGSSDTTASTTFTDLSGGASPSGTATTGIRVLTWFTVSMANNTVNGLCGMSADISGATTVAASDVAAIRATSATANAINHASVALIYSVNAGSNTFTGKYRVSAGTGTFGSRRMLIMSL